MTTMTTAENTGTNAALMQTAMPASANAVNRALQQFMQHPSVSNKVAAMAALKAYFDEVESRRA